MDGNEPAFLSLAWASLAAGLLFTYGCFTDIASAMFSDNLALLPTAFWVSAADFLFASAEESGVLVDTNRSRPDPELLRAGIIDALAAGGETTFADDGLRAAADLLAVGFCWNPPPVAKPPLSRGALRVGVVLDAPACRSFDLLLPLKSASAPLRAQDAGRGERRAVLGRGGGRWGEEWG